MDIVFFKDTPVFFDFSYGIIAAILSIIVDFLSPVNLNFIIF